MTPTVADNRTRNLLILRGPASDRPSVTAEAAGSSPVVPAILKKPLTDFPETPLWVQNGATLTGILRFRGQDHQK
jgi:hypothetical protein